VDNFLANDPQSVSFVGVIWPVKHYESVTNISLTLATFIDGGWFGVPGAPAPTNGLAATNLIEPVVQVSTNFGTNWVTVGSTSDYQTVMLGHFVGGTGGQPTPTSKTSTFTLTTPATRINGIRIIGTNGGRADGHERFPRSLRSHGECRELRGCRWRWNGRRVGNGIRRHQPTADATATA
jgi:hypothetical protein